MKPFEYFVIDCPEPAGAEMYRGIISDVLQDLDLIRIIGQFRVRIDPELPVFIAVGYTKKLPGLIHIGNFCNILPQPDGSLLLDVGSESSLASMLTVLWERFGRDNIDQPDRFTVVVHPHEPVSEEELSNIVVVDPGKGMYRDLIYGLQWAAPEGFKVRRQYHKNNRFYYVASEDTLSEDVVETLVAEQFAAMEAEQ